MSAAGLAARVALAVLLLVSGAAKLRDPAGTRTAAAGLGVPAALLRPVAVLLPALELLLAVLLLPGATARAAATASALLLLVLTAALVRALHRGTRVACACFGALSSAPLSGRSVARNALLLALAALGLAGASGPRTLPAVAGTVVAGLVVAAAVLAAEARAPRLRLDLPALDGSRPTVSGLLADGRPLVLLFLSTTCGPCRVLAPSVVDWADRYRDRLQPVVVLQSTPEVARALLGAQPALPVLLAPDDDLATRLGVPGLPSAVPVRADGRVVAEPAAGLEDVLALVADLVGEPVVVRQAADAPTLASVLVPRPGVLLEPAGDGARLVDPLTGTHVALDRLGALVWQCLDGRSPLADIVEDLADVFATPVEVVGPDTLALARTLAGAGVLTEVTVREGAPA